MNDRSTRHVRATPTSWRNHNHLPQWHEFGERLIWIVGGLFVLMVVAVIIAFVA